MAEKHTYSPGPWSVWADNNGRIKVGASTNCTVADLWHPPVGNAEANARLIAQAPAMLELIELVHLSFGGGRVITFSDDDIEKFAEVYAAATGEAP